MSMLSYKMRISALWVLEVVAFLVYRTIALNQNAYNASLLKNEELPGYLGMLAIFAILTLMLSQKWSRKTNIIAGFIMVGVQLIMFIDGFAEYSATIFNLITVGTIASTLSILWMAYKWPEKSS